MNKELQEKCYYMGDFEFKMLGLTYWLDEGHYFKVLSGINKLHEQMKSKEGLVKIPEFNDKEEEMEFYLNLQNPKTGAFIDDSYPYCTYNEVTENVLVHLDALAKETGKPLKLKYPLKYLDEINSPEKLTAFLDDVSHVGWIASKFPQTSFVFARSLLSYYNGEGVIGENNLYEFSPEWKETLIKWFYDNQDPDTGFWGPKSKTSEKLLKNDLTNTASIIKTFVDKNGNDIYENFPLKNKDKMFQTTLEVLSEPMPNDDELDEIHEWNLKMSKGISMLIRYLWKGASEENRKEAKKIIENYIRTKFEKNYISKDGAFSYYPNEKHATLDGMGNFFLFKDLGAFSHDKQEQLWESSEKNIIYLGISKVSEISKKDFEPMTSAENANSIRLYSIDPENNYLENVEMVFYAKETPVLDIMDLTIKVKRWIDATSQTMGNWVSREAVMQDLESIDLEEVPVYENKIPVKKINEILQNDSKVIAISFDVLQVPRYKKNFEKWIHP